MVHSRHLEPIPKAPHPLNLRILNHDLARLRQFRNRPDPDCTLNTPLTAVCRQIERQHRSAGGVADAWAAVLPPHLARHAEVVSFARGTLVIRAADASTRFQIDRFLRTGGQNELARRAGVAIRRIKLT
jgi:hypothetical protein